MINIEKFEEKIEKSICKRVNLLDDFNNRFDLEDDFSWNAKTEIEYNEIKAKFEGLEISNDYYEIWVWCDGSSFEYLKNDINYIQITFEIKAKFTYIHNYDDLVNDLIRIINNCEDIEEKFMKSELWNEYIKKM